MVHQKTVYGRAEQREKKSTSLHTSVAVTRKRHKVEVTIMVISSTHDLTKPKLLEIMTKKAKTFKIGKRRNSERGRWLDLSWSRFGSGCFSHDFLFFSWFFIVCIERNDESVGCEQVWARNEQLLPDRSLVQRVYRRDHVSGQRRVKERVDNLPSCLVITA